MVGDIFTATAYGAPGSNTLVVLSLRGGSDGLSLIVPHGDPGYAKARPTIGVPTRSLLAKDFMFGLHPEFKPLLPMWQSGTFGAVQAVVLPSRTAATSPRWKQSRTPTPAHRPGSAGSTGWSD